MPQTSSPPCIAVIGAGPAGLMAAEVLSAGGAAVTVYERMPSVARRLLIAGRGGLNLTHTEGVEAFLGRYGEAADRLRPYLDAFPPDALRAWADGLGQETFVGASGRVFPKAMKASPLLRAWLARLRSQGVSIRTRTVWRGWDAAGRPLFDGADARGAPEAANPAPDALVLALGGASWPRLGADGGWTGLFPGETSPFAPANAGFEIAWSAPFRDRFAGSPLKGVALSFGHLSVRGEAMVSAYGLEGGGVYALGAALREAIAAEGAAELGVDLRPEVSADLLAARLARRPRRRGETMSQHLRKALNLPPAAIGLLREGHGLALPQDPAALAAAVKAIRLRLTAPRPLEEAISSAGGLLWEALDGLMLRARPGVFVAGEMIDWEAPTGGYLLQACFATGAAAGREALAWARPPRPR